MGLAKTASPFVYMPAFFDSHTHIQSGNCAPLNVMWCKVAFLSGAKPDRETTNTFATVATGEGGRVQGSSTVEIGGDLVKALDEFIALRQKKEIIGSYVPVPNPEPGVPPISCAFPMTMDMEYACLDGYEGKTIYSYDDENKDCVLYIRDNGKKEFPNKTKISLGRNEYLLFERWKKQVSDTKKATLLHPWRLLPCYHYDPRRHNYANKQDVISGRRMLGADQREPYLQASLDPYCTPDMNFCEWDYFLAQVAGRTSKNKPGIFAGIKMYTMHGYRPLDGMCGCLWPFYKKCADEGIPIINHTSPGGNNIPDKPYYREYLEGKPNRSFEADASYTGSYRPQSNAAKSDDPRQYFSENFVHPRNWRPVLEKFPELKLNLAHFGGDEWGDGPKKSDWIVEIISIMRQYKNVHTDISCFNLKKNKKHFMEFLATDTGRELSDRILFGSDWYMILLALLKLDPEMVAGAAEGAASPLAPLAILVHLAVSELMGHGLFEGKNYSDFCIEMKQMLDEVGWRLWYKFSIINPFRFYGLDNPVLLDNIEAGLKQELKTNQDLKDSEKGQINKQIADGKQKIMNLANQVKELEQKLKRKQ